MFRGKFLCYSNFYPWTGRRQVGHDIQVAYDGVLYPTSEHAFVAAKTLIPEQRIWATSCDSPGEAKRRGRQVPLRPDWDATCDHIMWMVVLDKFLRNPELAAALLYSENAELQEGNTWGDTRWGVVNGIGENRLGKILMGVRSVLRGRSVRDLQVNAPDRFNFNA